MKYIRRYARDRAVIAELTVWRRLVVVVVLVVLAKLVGDQVIGAICLVIAAVVGVSAIHVFALKMRMSIWP